MPTVIHSVNPYLEPTTVWIHDQIRSLDRYEPVVYSRYTRNRDRFPVDRLVDFTSGGWLTGLSDRVRIRLSGTYPRYGAQAVRDSADLIHAHFGQEGFRCLDAKGEAGIPLVTTFYGLDVSALPKIAVWQKRFGRLFVEGDLFLAEGPHMASTLRGIGCPEEKVRVQPLGVDLSAFTYRSPSQREAVGEVLMYASLREKKGHRYGLEAFARIAAEFDARMTIIGDGPLRTDLESRTAVLGVQDRVRFLGSLDHDTCKQHLAEATVLLYPSVIASDGDTEGGAPVGILEAMASGLPVVSTRHADIPFVTNDGAAAYLTEERNVDGLVEGLREILGAQSEAVTYAEAGREAVESRHALEAQGAALEERYDEAIGA